MNLRLLATGALLLLLPVVSGGCGVAPDAVGQPAALTATVPVASPTPPPVMATAVAPAIVLPASARDPIPEGPDAVVGCGPYLEAWVRLPPSAPPLLMEATNRGLGRPDPPLSRDEAAGLAQGLRQQIPAYEAWLDRWRGLAVPPAFQRRHDRMLLTLQDNLLLAEALLARADAIARDDARGLQAGTDQLLAVLDRSEAVRLAYRDIDLTFRPCPEPYDGPPLPRP